MESPKTKTIADGLIERTSSMLDKTELKTMHKDERAQNKALRIIIICQGRKTYKCTSIHWDNLNLTIY